MNPETFWDNFDSIIFNTNPNLNPDPNPNHNTNPNPIRARFGFPFISLTIGTRFRWFPFIYFWRSVAIFIFSPKNLMLVDQNGYKKDSILNIIQIRDTSSSFIFSKILIYASVHIHLPCCWMESGLFLDSQVDIWRHNIIGDVCGIGHACGTGPISKSFIYIRGLSSLQMRNIKQLSI
jgi:hypothetical protein